MQENYTTQPTPKPSEAGSTNEHSVSINGALALIVVLIPITLYVGLKTYKRYRAAVLRQQIATLEKIWRLDSKKKKA